MSDHEKKLFSCLVDNSPIFYYQAWILIKSLIENSNVPPRNIFLHATKGVENYFLNKIKFLEVNVQIVEPFGDGKYCNKICQLETLAFEEAEYVYLMDTDMIVLGDINHIGTRTAIGGKIVDLPNPSLKSLKNIFSVAGFENYPAIRSVDFGIDETFETNLNGGLYVIPGEVVSNLRDTWKKWALWLLENITLLEREGKQNHVDQVAFALACHELKLPVKNLDRVYNHPTHLPHLKNSYPHVLHYHRCVTKTGLLEKVGECNPDFIQSIDEANTLIGKCFDNEIFRPLQYSLCPHLGSDISSSENNLEKKSELLKLLNIESAPGVLDVGCGDLEVVKEFDLQDYVGVDSAPLVIKTARAKRSDWTFILLEENEDSIPEKHTVLCFEVLIHQKSHEDYERLIDFLARKTRHRLIVSGYTTKQEHINTNHMVYFHESLIYSLQKTGKFRTIQKISTHSDGDIIVADVAENSNIVAEILEKNIPEEELEKLSRVELFLHIGTSKTGSTSLQHFLFDHSELLMRKNVLYPDPHACLGQVPKHQFLVNHLIQTDLLGFRNAILGISKQINNNVQKVVLSSEGLFYHLSDFVGVASHFIKALAKFTKVTVVIYLRPQAEFIESLYRQIIINPQTPGIEEHSSNLTIQEFMRLVRTQENLDYSEALKAWSEMIGEDRILVRIYTRNVINDFLNVLGIEVQSEFNTSYNAKPSMSREVIEIIRHLNPLIDAKFKSRVITILANQVASEFEETLSFLSFDEQVELMTKYSEGNSDISRRWLDRDNLFPDFTLTKRNEWHPINISDKKIIDVLLKTVQSKINI